MDKLSYPKNKIKIILLENIHSQAADIFKSEGFTNLELVPRALEAQELVEHIHDAHVVGIRSATHLTEDVLQQCKHLLAVGCFCIGTNQVDLSAAMLQGVPVFNDPHSNTRSVAELVIGFCIMLMRDLFHKNAAAHAGKWIKSVNGACEVRGKTLGIVGYGRIGSQLSILAESLGMHVCYYDIEQKLSIGNAKQMTSLEELLSCADIVSLHVPETSSTRHMINADRLLLMKKTAYLINTSRGSTVDIDAMHEALEENRLRGAAIDVFPKEPKDNAVQFKSVLQNNAQVILTPHIGGATEEAQENIGKMVSTKLIYFINRGSTEGAVNFPALSLQPHTNSHRILHVHLNRPGMMSKINTILADKGINILAQYLMTNQEVGYVVLDIQSTHHTGIMDDFKNIPGTIRTRILY